MTTRQPVAEGLISCRNILLGGRTNDHVLPCLQNILLSLDSIEVSSTRKIVERCVPQVVGRIQDADFIGAGRVLNLIHNLPLDKASEQRWDIDYFLSMELATFLEHFDEIKAARMITLYVCQQLGFQYLPNN